MKKIILFLFCAVLVTACKKNSSSHKDVLLSKIFINGEPEEEFAYNADGQVIEGKTYNKGILAYVYKYVYDASGKLKEMTYYHQPDNKASGKYVYTLDAQGRISRFAVYDLTGGGAGVFSTYIDYEYDGKGQLIKQSWIDEDDELSTFRVINYYDNGNMRNTEVWYNYGPSPTKEWASSYGHSDTSLPASFSKVKAYPVNFYLPYLVSSYVDHYTYNGGNISDESKEVVTARQFNEWGLVKQQTITTKDITGGDPDEVVVMQYEYVAF